MVCSSQSARVDLQSNIIVTNNHIYFYSYDYKVYDLVYDNGTGLWTATNWPLVDYAPTVRPGCKLTNDYESILYVGSNWRVSIIFWDPVGQFWDGGVISTPMTTEPVRPNSQIVWFDGHVYYVGLYSSRVCDLVWDGGWSGHVLNHSSVKVKSNTEIAVFYNEVYEEGTSYLNRSHHVVYTGIDNQLRTLVYDDKICTFRPFACFDPEDIYPPPNGNGTGWDDQSGEIVNALAGYDCSGCRTPSGETIKTWFEGKLVKDALGISEMHSIHVFGRDIFAVAENEEAVCHYTRIRNPSVNDYEYPLYWSDEFDGNDLDQLKWRRNLPWANHTPNACGDFFWYEESFVSVNNGYCELRAEEHDPPVMQTNVVWYIDSNGNWVPGGYDLDYSYSGSMLTSESPNGDYTNGYFELSYGFMELRARVPRGKYYWPAFWMYKHADDDTDDEDEEDINIEIEGNGRTYMSTVYCDDAFPGCYLGYKLAYAVGFRYYEDTFLYSIDWRTDSILFYFNREVVGRFVNLSIDENHHLVVTHALVDAYGLCEAENFPDVFMLDYVRVYRDPALPEMDSNVGNGYEREATEDKLNLFGMVGEVTVYNITGQVIGVCSIARVRECIGGGYIGAVIIEGRDSGGKVHRVKAVFGN